MSDIKPMKINEKAIETACRQYCKLMGLNPDESVILQSSTQELMTFDFAAYGPRWKNYRERVYDQIVMHHVVKCFYERHEG